MAQKKKSKGTDLFWKPPSMEELAEMQGVSPIDNLEELSDLWPKGDDPDALLEHILAERYARRELNG